MQERKTYSFNATLETVKLNHVTTAVFLPHHIILELPKGRLRVSGVINGIPFSLAIQFKRDGSRFFTIGATLRSTARLETGDPVSVSFRIISLREVDLPDMLDSRTTVIEEPGLRKFVSIAAGSPLSAYVSVVRSADSRLRKSLEIIQRSKATVRPAQPNRKNKNK